MEQPYGSTSRGTKPYPKLGVGAHSVSARWKPHEKNPGHPGRGALLAHARVFYPTGSSVSWCCSCLESALCDLTSEGGSREVGVLLSKSWCIQGLTNPMSGSSHICFSWQLDEVSVSSVFFAPASSTFWLKNELGSALFRCIVGLGLWEANPIEQEGLRKVVGT